MPRLRRLAALPAFGLALIWAAGAKADDNAVVPPANTNPVFIPIGPSQPVLNPVAGGPTPIDATGGSGPVYVPAVPEPASIAVLGLGLGGLAAARRKRA